MYKSVFLFSRTHTQQKQKTAIHLIKLIVPVMESENKLCGRKTTVAVSCRDFHFSLHAYLGKATTLRHGR